MVGAAIQGVDEEQQAARDRRGAATSKCPTPTLTIVGGEDDSGEPR